MKRDEYFNYLIVFLLIACANSYYREIKGILIDDNHLYTLPRWYYYIALVLNTISVFGVYKIYHFKKIGLYLFFIPVLIDFFVQLLSGTFNTASLFFVFLSFTLVIVKIYPKWNDYD